MQHAATITRYGFTTYIPGFNPAGQEKDLQFKGVWLGEAPSPDRIDWGNLAPLLGAILFERKYWAIGFTTDWEVAVAACAICILLREARCGHPEPVKWEDGRGAHPARAAWDAADWLIREMRGDI